MSAAGTVRAGTRRAASLERYAQACGPAAVAKALGTTRLRAAELLRAAGVGPRKIGTTTSAMVRAIRGQGLLAYSVGVHHPRPTLTQWRRANPRCRAIVCAGGHAVLVNRGRVLEDNGVPKARGRVRAVILLEGRLGREAGL